MLFSLPSSTKNKSWSADNANGFTLIEILVTLVIGIILAAIAMPQFTNTVLAQRTKGEITSLYNDLQFARVEAIKEGQEVTICTSNNQTGCTSTPWVQGWIIYSNPTAATTPATGTILKVQAGFFASGATNPDVVTTTPSSTTVVNFNREGFLISQTAGILFDLQTYDNNKGATRCVWASPIGTAYLQNITSTAQPQQATSCT